MYINGVWFEECEARAYVNRLLAELQRKDELLRQATKLLNKAVENCRLSWNEAKLDWEWEYEEEAREIIAMAGCC